MACEYTKEAKVAIFTVNRPEALNSLDMATIRELGEAMSDFDNDPGLWVGIVTGAGEKAFCVGADIKDTLPFMREHRETLEADFPPSIMRGIKVKKPLIAAINGHALGGGLELALACDVRICSEKARLGVPEVTLGLVPGWGGTQRLPRVIPAAKAAEMLLTGVPIDAAEAYRIGLVNRVVAPELVMEEARKMAEAICKPAPLAVMAAKEAMLKGIEMSLDDGLRLENSLITYLTGTEDFNEGITAFAEKRKPEYKGK